MARTFAEHLASAMGTGPEAPRRLQVVIAREPETLEPSRADLAGAARRYLRSRRQREAAFPSDLFADPAWDVLLDLFACGAEGKPVTVTDACIAANVPSSTALRWLSKIESCGLVTRRLDPADRRRIHLELTPHADKQIARWLKSAFRELCRA